MENTKQDMQEMSFIRADAFAEKVLDTKKAYSDAALASGEHSKSKDLELYLKLHIANHRPG